MTITMRDPYTVRIEERLTLALKLLAWGVSDRDGDEARPGTALYESRVHLGLDGRSGARDIRSDGAGLPPTPVVLAVDPGVQVEQETRCPCGQEHDDMEVRGLGMVCGRCGRHTGNNTQGHYWKACSVKAAESKAEGLTGLDAIMADWHHFCCPPPFGCELNPDSAAEATA